MPGIRRTLVAMFALVALGTAFRSMAGAGAAAFTVDITLTAGAGVSPTAVGSGVSPTASGVCVSQALSDENGALVRVACDTGQFVSVSPLPGARFVGTHGGAYSYSFGPSLGGVNLAGFGQFANGAGSIASFRVYDVTESDGLLGMLVSF